MHRRRIALTLLLPSGTLGAQDAHPTFSVGTATATRGATAMGTIVVPATIDSGLRIPVAVIHGARPGPVVAFVAGSHGTEYASIVAMQRLIPRLDARKLSGTVIVAPLLNIASFEAMTPHLNPVDRKGMNGQYPGDSTGTQSPRALALVTREIVAPADVIIDLHGGDLDEDLRPYSYWMRSGRPAQDSAGRALVMAFGLDHVIVQDVNPAAPAAGRSLSGQALVRGKTVLVAEAGRSGTVEAGGMCFATVHRDTRVRAGTVLGYTTDDLGRKTRDIRAPIDGLVTFIRGVPSMLSLIHISEPTRRTPISY